MTTQLLIIVDMLNDFIRPDGALYCGPGAEAIVKPVARRLDHHRRAGSHIVFLQDAHAADDKEFDRFPPHCVAGTPGSAIIDELAPRSGEAVVPKTRYSGFFGTDLADRLASAAPDQVEVAGVCTSICVMDTVGGLANRDFAVLVHRDAVADFDPRFHDMALERMEKLYGARIV